VALLVEFRFSLNHRPPHPPRLLSQLHSQRLKSRLTRQSFPGLFTRKEDLASDNQASRYRHLWERAWSVLKPTAVFCVEGWPTIYFRKVTKRSIEDEHGLQRKLWNLGHATVLVVFDDKETRIYSGLATPNPNQKQDVRRVGDALQTATFSAELVEWLYAFQSGSFYAKAGHRDSFTDHGRLDRYLLRNLSEARNALCDAAQLNPLSIVDAHSLLGRCLFASYLLEREVLNAAYLKGAKVPHCKRLRELLAKNSAQVVGQLYRLFRKLQADFNGSLFGADLDAEEERIQPDHLRIVRDFLEGFDFESGQLPLAGDFYDFSLIPVELISAIYEDFVAAADGKETKPAAGSQRSAGAYYTPPRLAELVVDIATEGMDDRLDALKCLDPACGSGIFLVLLFQRMAQHWRARNPRATRLATATRLRAMLTGQLYGVDRNEHACRVVCFSLYLAFLDQFPRPRDIRSLQREFRKPTGERLLPPLLGQRDCIAAGSTIHPLNFFDVAADALGGFDLIIGNPPWTGRYQQKDPQAVKWNAENAAKLLGQKRSNKADIERLFYPQTQTVVPFMWKTPLHLRDAGRGCLLIAAKTLFGNDTSEFQAEWFSRFSVSSVWQLSDYRRFLFGEAKHPGVVLRYSPAPPATPDAEIPYYTPKVERFDPRETTICVGPDEHKTLYLDELLAAARRGEAFTHWKRHFWGTARDQRVLDRLLRLPRLSALADEPEEKTGQPINDKRWLKSQGFQPWTRKEEADENAAESEPSKRNSDGKPKPRWWKDEQPYLDVNRPWSVTIIPENLKPIGAKPAECRRRPHKAVHSTPLVMVNQGFSKIAFCDEPAKVLFGHRLNTISGLGGDHDLIAFVSAVLMSPLGKYLIFHLCGTWGVERLEVHLQEILLLPFPLPEQMRNPERSRAIVRDVAAIFAETKARLTDPQRLRLDEDLRAEAVALLTPLVYDYYGIPAWQQRLMEETATIFAESCTPASLNSKIATLEAPGEDVLRDYAKTLCRILETTAARGLWRVIPRVQRHLSAGVALLTLERRAVDHPEFTAWLAEHRRVEVEDAERPMRTILARMATAARRRKKNIGWLRGFTLIEPERIHVLKPLTLRYWTATAAMNDADRLADHLIAAAREDA